MHCYNCNMLILKNCTVYIHIHFTFTRILGSAYSFLLMKFGFYKFLKQNTIVHYYSTSVVYHDIRKDDCYSITGNLLRFDVKAADLSPMTDALIKSSRAVYDRIGALSADNVTYESVVKVRLCIKIS